MPPLFIEVGMHKKNKQKMYGGKSLKKKREKKKGDLDKRKLIFQIKTSFLF